MEDFPCHRCGLAGDKARGNPLYWKAHKVPVGLQTTSCSSCYLWGSNLRNIPISIIPVSSWPRYRERDSKKKGKVASSIFARTAYADRARQDKSSCFGASSTYWTVVDFETFGFTSHYINGRDKRVVSLKKGSVNPMK